MNWAYVQQIITTLIVCGMIAGGVEILPFDNTNIKRGIGSVMLFAAAIWLGWRFLLPAIH